MTARKAAAPQARLDVAPREVALARFTEIITLIPEGSDDGSGIMLDLLNATSWEELNREDGDLPSLEQQIGKVLIIHDDMTRHASTIEGSLPFYIIVQVTDTSTGETFRINTSAAVPTVQIAQLRIMGVLPAMVEVTRSKKATRAGFFPIDLHIVKVNVKV